MVMIMTVTDTNKGLSETVNEFYGEIYGCCDCGGALKYYDSIEIGGKHYRCVKVCLKCEKVHFAPSGKYSREMQTE